MNILIVHAHPEPLSFTTSLKTTAQQTFKKLGHQVEISDLYAMQFNPVASKEDFLELNQPDYFNYALEQRNATKQQLLATDIQAEIDKVNRADLVILNFPLYWTSVPAILKGWIDRVFVSGLFYGGKRFYNHGGMAGKKAMLCLTLGGRTHMFGKILFTDQLNIIYHRFNAVVWLILALKFFPHSLPTMYLTLAKKRVKLFLRTMSRISLTLTNLNL